jgi:hypothetical protein
MRAFYERQSALPYDIRTRSPFPLVVGGKGVGG